MPYLISENENLFIPFSVSFCVLSFICEITLQVIHIDKDPESINIKKEEKKKEKPNRMWENKRKGTELKKKNYEIIVGDTPKWLKSNTFSKRVG